VPSLRLRHFRAVKSSGPPRTVPYRGGHLSALARAVAGPVIAALVVTGLLAAWVRTGGAGTLTRVRLQVSLAAVPMRAFTAQAAAADRSATTFVTIRNLSGTPDQFVAARSPLARRVVLTGGGPARSGTTVPSLTIPAHGTLQLSPFGEDAVLQDPPPFETLAAVPLVLTFRHAGTVTGIAWSLWRPAAPVRP
jgi:copper(I)-binding protein